MELFPIETIQKKHLFDICTSYRALLHLESMLSLVMDIHGIWSNNQETNYGM